MKNKYFFLLLFSLTSSIISAQLVINEAHYDPESTILGDANGDGNRDATEDEFLEFVNNSDTPLDISGYKIFDATNLAINTPRHEVPANTTIPAGGVYVVFGGGDVSSIDALANVTAHVSSSGSLSMTNSNEVMTVTDASDNVLITLDAADLNTSDNQSLERRPAITGDFYDHKAINGAFYSPGVVGPSFSNVLVLNEIFARPGLTTGDANGDGTGNAFDDEFIELVNNSGASIDISGYKIYDYTRYKSDVPNHVVPNGTVIPDGGVYVLFGGGTPTGTFGNAIVQTCSNTDDKLSATNSGDTFFIKNTSDELVFVLNTKDISDDFTVYEAYTRTPDITGEFTLHRTATADVKFSPGTKSDGTNFSGVLRINKFLQNNVKLYVAHNKLKIEGTLEGKNQLKIYNLLGKVVVEKSFNTENTNSIKLPKLQLGVYVVSLTNNSYGTITKKIIIE